MRTTWMVLKANRKDISYLRWTLESYDGMALVSTLDAKSGYVAVRIAPGCEGMVTELLHHLAREEGVEVACLDGGRV